MTDIAISVQNLSKCFQIYDNPRDRLKQFVVPRIQHFSGKKSKQYFREFWALRDASFEIKKGETVGIIGRNGSGKSTLLQMICGTLTPTSGGIQTNGRIAALLELGSGFNPEFTGLENIYLNASILGFSSDEIEAVVEQVVEFSGVGEFIAQPIKSYSTGMVLRLAFSVAVNIKPEILVVDEALAVGDELFQRKCFAKIYELKKKGTTVLFVSHASTQIVELCNRAILLDHGEIVFQGNPKDALRLYTRINNDKGFKINENTLSEIINPDYSRENSESCVPLKDKEWFDDNLIVLDKVTYNENGARVEALCIYDDTGNEVNHLVRGKFYTYSYSVEFFNKAKNVRFGFAISTKTGLLVSGAFTATDANRVGIIKSINAGKTVKVEFRFKCNLNPGLYFINSGVYGLVAQEETVMHRLIGGLAFRVQQADGDLELGNAWLQISSGVL